METINQEKNLMKYELPELEQKGLFRRWYYKPTQSAVSKKEYYYAADDFTALKTALVNARLDGLKNLHRQPDSNVKLVVVVSKDGKFAAAQVFRYQPFEFMPESEVFMMKDAEVQAFLAMFEKH